MELHCVALHYVPVLCTNQPLILLQYQFIIEFFHQTIACLLILYVTVLAIPAYSLHMPVF